MYVLRIYAQDPGEGRIDLGTVVSHHRDPHVAMTIVEQAWPSFQNTRPQADSDFIAFLIKHYGFEEHHGVDEIEVRVGD